MSDERLVEIVMPQMGISVAEATLIGWRKQPGERVEMDEPICDISSDKVDSDVPAPARGRLVELLVAVGETVDVGTPIALFATDEAAGAATAAAEGAGAKPPGAAGVLEGEAEATTTDAAAASASRGDARHSPVVARLAQELGVELDKVVGTGAGGRIRREDVLGAADAGPEGDRRVPEPPDALSQPYRPPATETLSRMRRTIGEHMLRSLRTAATVTQWIEVDFEAVEARRRALRVTALPIVASATLEALAEYGDLNAWLDGEDYTRHSDVNLGIAVSLGAEGLIVPVIRAAQRLEVQALAQRITDLARRARAHELSADEVRGGTFTITNPGQFGTLMATPVIHQPQVAILDIETIARRPVVVDDGAGGERVAIHSVCILGLSWDHRALDGAYAARFLAALRERLQAPLEG